MKLFLLAALLPFTAQAAGNTVTLASGQSVLLCTSASYAVDAAKALSAQLVAGRQLLKVETSDGIALVNAPYSVSAPGIASADREADSACVTITKQ